jgi:hypothetical protein
MYIVGGRHDTSVTRRRKQTCALLPLDEAKTLKSRCGPLLGRMFEIRLARRGAGRGLGVKPELRVGMSRVWCEGHGVEGR